ncbi:hypothetical protein B0H14DRAFT_2573581 [Mycena olivaceomarginata]|nr:hypothetical protein B0H14DRAFT_2573581 [Mycena olivaceomarginata]
MVGSSHPFATSRFILDESLSAAFLSDVHCISREESIPPAHLSSSVDHPSADLARCDAEIAPHVSPPSPAKSPRHRPAVCGLSIRWLPVEILTDIFRRIWVDFQSYRCPFELILAALAPLLDLSRVSNVQARGSHNLPVAKGLLQSALQRSRDLPLRIHVKNYARYNTDRNKSLLDNAVLNLLSNASSRWKTTKFVCFQEDIFNCDVEHRPPLLEAS